MKILSWDVGIYNLSYCILEKNETDGKINIIGIVIGNIEPDIGIIMDG